jgi:hypothetical protein
VYNYTSPASLNQYLLHTQPATRYQAEDACVALGGHLATYHSLGEQFEAERGLVLLGALLPGFHRSYWLGLSIPQVRARALRLQAQVALSAPPSWATLSLWPFAEPS